MQDPTNPLTESSVKSLPELSHHNRTQKPNRGSAVWLVTKSLGRGTAIVLGFMATAYYLKTVYGELSLARQERNQVLTPEVDESLRRDFPKSNHRQRQKIALAESYGPRARAEVASEILYQEILNQPRSRDEAKPQIAQE